MTKNLMPSSSRAIEATKWADRSHKPSVRDRVGGLPTTGGSDTCGMPHFPHAALNLYHLYRYTPLVEKSASKQPPFFFGFARYHFAKAHIWRASGFEDLIAICRTRKCYGSHWRWSCFARGQPITRPVESDHPGTNKNPGKQTTELSCWKVVHVDNFNWQQKIAPHQSRFLWEVLMVARETSTEHPRNQ